MARPTKLTPDRHTAILQAILAGNYAETAARYAGVTSATFYNWMNRGRDAKSGLYMEFFDAVENAKAQAETRDVALIERAANETWQAAAWMLERKFPDRWGRRERTELSGPGGGPIQMEHDYDIKDKLVARILGIAARRENAGGTLEDDADAGG